MKIMINFGHAVNGTDWGACYNGLREAEVNKTIGTTLANYLKSYGYDVTTYQQTKSVNDVWREENKSKYDILISIHCNAFNSTANGHEVLYYPTSDTGKKLAQCIQTSLVKTVGLRDRGLKPRNDLAVLKRTKTVAVIVETAFISNPSEAKLLREKPDLFAKAIALGVKNYFGNQDTRNTQCTCNCHK